MIESTTYVDEAVRLGFKKSITWPHFHHASNSGEMQEFARVDKSER